MQTLNEELFLEINQFAGVDKGLDSVMISVAEYTPYLFILILFYLWFTNRKNEALYAGYATTLGIIINQAIGVFYFHPRPFMQNLGTTLLAHKPDSSFPSDHTTFTLSIALMLVSFKSTRILGVVLAILALWCGGARVYLGVHWPFDIAGSIVVSLFAVIIIGLSKNNLAGLNSLIIATWHKVFKAKNV